MRLTDRINRILSMLLVLVMIVSLVPVSASAAGADETLMASLEKAEKYIDGITINNSSNDPATVVKNFKTHFTWDNEKRENSKSYLFDWSYYNGVVFEGIEFVYEVTGESVYKDYVMEYMSSLIASNGTWATCSNNSSKQCAGYNSTHGADCYKTASLLLDAYAMSGDSRYLTMAKTLYTDLTNAAKSYSLSKAGNNFRHTWASDPSPDLWLDGLYMILPFRAEYAKYIGDTAELNLIVSRMQWVSDNMYNSSKGLFYHAADSATSNSNTFWLRSIGWYAAAIVDIMDSMSGSNLEAMKVQLKKLVDGMKACQNASNGMWLNNMAASQSTSNPYETSGTALTCYAVMKAVNNGWLDKSYADMAILAFNGICREKLSGSNLKDICFKGAPGSSNSTFYDNEGKGLGPFIMFYAEMLEYVNNNSCDHDYASVTVDATCTKEGSVTYTCTLCGDSYAETIPATGAHDYTYVSEEATCTEPGTATGTCTVCGKVVVEKVESLGHDYACAVTEATCSKDGLKVYTCSRCDDTYTEVIPATGDHTYTSETVDATVTEDGAVIYTCTVCGHSYSEVIPAIGVTTYTLTEKTGTVDRYAAASAYTGAQLIVSNNHGTNYVDVTVGMLTDGNGKAVSTSAANMLTGLKVVYNGETVATGFVLEVLETDGDWVALPKGYTYTLDTNGMDVGSDNKYLVVGSNNDYALTLSGSTIGAAKVTIKDNQITLEDPSKYEFYFVSNNSKERNTYLLTRDGSKSVYHMGGNMYYGTDNKGYWYVASNSNGTYKVYDYDNLNWYLNYGYVWGSDAVSRFAVSSTNTRTVRLFKLSGSGYDGYARLSGATRQAYCAEDGATLASVLNKITIQTGSDGIHVGQEIALTPAMVSWDKTFSGSAVGTYTGTVTYGEQVLGTIVVSITHEHDYETVTKAATCTEDGSVTTTCAICGDSTVEKTPALGHDYTCETVAATCGKDGSKDYTCGRCANTYSEVIPATGKHSYESVTVDATCAEAGSVTHTCSVCGNAYVDVISATGKHSYESVTVDATCAEAGSVTHTCSVCGNAYVDVIPATGKHSYESVTVDATCAEDGSVTHTCSVCGNAYVDVIPATGKHSYESVTVDATCAEDGSVTHTCSVCGNAYVDVIPATGKHTYETVTVEATCTESGLVTDTCSLCGKVELEKLEALGHAYTCEVIAATCGKDGSKDYTCGRCADTYSEVIPATGKHTYKSVAVDATCAEAGSVTYTCVCGDTYTEVIPATGKHTYKTVTVEATCAEAGAMIHTCDVCGDTYTDVIPATGKHSYETVTVDATCTESGMVTDTCSVCGKVEQEKLEALGHDHVCVVTEATCGQDGAKVYTCSRCDDTYTEVLPATGDHTYTSKTVDATVTEDGAVIYTCTVCGHSYSEVIPAIGETTYTLTEKTGFVDRYADASAYTGAQLIVSNNHGTSYVDVTVGILGDGNGKAVSTSAANMLTGLKVVYNGETVATGFVLEVLETDGDWVALPKGYTYTLDTNGMDVGSNNKYLVVGSNNDYALTLSGSTIGAAKVTVKDNQITLEDPAKYEFYFVSNNSKERNTYLLTRDGSKSVYHMGGNMYYGNDNKGYWYVAADSNGKYRVYDYDNCNWFLNYGYVWGSDAVSRYAVSYNSRNVRLFKLTGSANDGYARLSGATRQNYSIADAVSLDTVLSKVQVQTGTDGATVSKSVALTSAMVSWDKTFNGRADGVYTGTVTYEGQVLGTVVVTVTHKHTYETVTVEATCTENGSITTTCTLCGDNTVEEIKAFGHDYNRVVIDATCAEDGSVTDTCTVCGDRIVEVKNALGHQYDYVVTDATVTEDGSVVGTCTVCGDICIEVIPAIGETTYTLTEKTGFVDRYADASAYTGAQLMVSNNHGTDYVDVTVGMLADAMGRTVSTAEADMLTGLKVVYNGKTVATGFVLEILEIDGDWVAMPKGYTYTLDTNGVDTGSANKYLVVAADTNRALTLSNTTVGNAAVTVKDNTITLEDPAKFEFYFQPSGNYLLLTQDGRRTVYHENAVMKYGSSSAGNWTVTNNGNGKYQVLNKDGNGNWSLNYGYIWGNNAVSYFGVSYYGRNVRLFKLTGSAYDGFARLNGTTRQSYSTADGATLDAVLRKVNIQTSTDGSTAGKDIALTSAMVSWDKAFSGTAAGTYTGTVTYGEQVLGTITVTVVHAHDYETVTVDATCTEEGSVTTVCTLCGDSTEEVVEALGHDYDCLVEDASCAEDGSKDYCCTVCGDTYSEVIPATGAHSYETVTVDATCTEEGLVTSACTVCGDSMEEVLAALGHDYDCVETDATCVEAGSAVYTCAACADTYTEEIPANGHVYADTEEGIPSDTCAVCGQTETEE